MLHCVSLPLWPPISNKYATIIKEARPTCTVRLYGNRQVYRRASCNTQEPLTCQRTQGFGRRTDEEQREDDDELIDSVSEDVLGHGAGDERLVATVRLPLQQRLGGWFRCQGQGRKRVHDQVHPQHLHGLQRRVLMEMGGVER